MPSSTVNGCSYCARAYAGTWSFLGSQVMETVTLTRTPFSLALSAADAPSADSRSCCCLNSLCLTSLSTGSSSSLSPFALISLISSSSWSRPSNDWPLT